MEFHKLSLNACVFYYHFIKAILISRFSSQCYTAILRVTIDIEASCVVLFHGVESVKRLETVHSDLFPNTDAFRYSIRA